MAKGRPRRRAADGAPPRAQLGTIRTAASWQGPRRLRAGLNGQIAVDGHRQIITAHRLSTNAADYGGLVPLVDATTAALGPASA